MVVHPSRMKFSFLLFLMVALFFGGGTGSSLLLESAHAANGENAPFPGNTNFIVDIAKNKTPAVVNVSTRAKLKNAHQPGPPGGNPFEGFIDPNFPSQKRPPRGGTGSGFVIDKEGHILTNHHVVAGAEEITVRFPDEKEYKAILIGSDSKTDIALIKISPKPVSLEAIPTLDLGNSDALEVGEWVIAIGNPFGLDHTVTAGIVSAKGRNIGSGPYDEFIQTDASINPGNSGGPLLNSRGQVIGINTAIFSGNSGGNIGIGFALPINLAKDILQDLKVNGKVSRGWLGVMIQKITPELAEAFKLQDTHGALVGNVIAGSPADKGGMVKGDVITAFAGKEVKTMETLPKLVAGVPPGEDVTVDVIRDGIKKQLQITLSVLEEKET